MVKIKGVSNLPNLKVGTVTHFFDKVGVAVVDLKGGLSLGETVEFEKSGFSQVVSSMQIEHEQIATAKKGQTIGLKVDKKVKSGDTVLKKA